MGPCFISVDIETAGPNPAEYAVLAIGACLVDDPDTGFYAELRPESDAIQPEAVRVSGLDVDRLRRHGEDPAVAFGRFAAWIDGSIPDGAVPVLVGFNAPFDWMFTADGLLRHTGRNPFGHSALDIKALAMGADRLRWDETAFGALARRYGLAADLPHHALEDARLQAELFRRILARLETRRTHE